MEYIPETKGDLAFSYSSSAGDGLSSVCIMQSIGVGWVLIADPNDDALRERHKNLIFKMSYKRCGLKLNFKVCKWNKILVSIFYDNLFFLQRCFSENTKQQIWGLRALCSCIKHPNVDLQQQSVIWTYQNWLCFIGNVNQTAWQYLLSPKWFAVSVQMLFMVTYYFLNLEFYFFYTW